MPEYRRAYVPGGTFFFSIVTHERRPIFADSLRVQQLRQVLAAVRSQRLFEIVAAVVLPDHVHFIWTLPEGDSDYSWRIGRMKALFTKSLGQMPDGLDTSALSRSRQRRHESNVWQRRFWEHVIRDEQDHEHHLNYIHYNPVKHGLVGCPHAWPHSSFGKWVRRGTYARDWCCACATAEVRRPYPEELDRTVGE